MQLSSLNAKLPIKSITLPVKVSAFPNLARPCAVGAAAAAVDDSSFSRAQVGHSLVSGCGESGAGLALRPVPVRFGSGGDMNGDRRGPTLLLRDERLGIGLSLAAMGECITSHEQCDSGLNSPRPTERSSSDKVCTSEKKGSCWRLFALGLSEGSRLKHLATTDFKRPNSNGFMSLEAISIGGGSL
jgi:hypothetical protein